jgi:hypothetical protein
MQCNMQCFDSLTRHSDSHFSQVKVNLTALLIHITPRHQPPRDFHVRVRAYTAGCHGHVCRPTFALPAVYISCPPLALLLLSLALFAIWLRSSVVSVLFSLIAETFLRELPYHTYFSHQPTMLTGLAHSSLALCRSYRTIWGVRKFEFSFSLSGLALTRRLRKKNQVG